MLTLINNNIFELKLQSDFSHIRFIKVERNDESLSRETMEFSFTKPKSNIIINTENVLNELIIIILEINNKSSELIYSYKNSNTLQLTQANNEQPTQPNNEQPTQSNDEQQPEEIPQLQMIANMFGTQELDLKESNIEQTNKVFENFGKGFSQMFSSNPPEPQIQVPVRVNAPSLVKNESQNISLNIKKKRI
jgi:hypothetical protein